MSSSFYFWSFSGVYQDKFKVCRFVGWYISREISVFQMLVKNVINHNQRQRLIKFWFLNTSPKLVGFRDSINIGLFSSWSGNLGLHFVAFSVISALHNYTCTFFNNQSRSIKLGFVYSSLIHPLMFGYTFPSTIGCFCDRRCKQAVLISSAQFSFYNHWTATQMVWIHPPS